MIDNEFICESVSWINDANNFVDNSDNSDFFKDFIKRYMSENPFFVEGLAKVITGSKHGSKASLRKVSKEEFKSITGMTLAEFARDKGITRQLLNYRLKSGWQIGWFNGDMVFYNPKEAMRLLK